MKDIKDILIFLGVSLRHFLIYFFYNFFYLLAALVVIFSVVLLDFRFFTRILNMAVFFLAIIFVYRWMKNTFLMRQKWPLFLGFSQFLKSRQLPTHHRLREKDSELRFSHKRIKTQLKAFEADLRKNGFQWISKDRALAVLAFFNDHQNKPFKWSGDVILKLRRAIIKGWLMQIGAIFLLFDLFLGISFLLSLGIHPEIRYLVFFIGFLFVFFLNAAIVDPIFSLLFQKSIYSLVSKK